MKEEYENFAARFARAVIAEDFAAAHACLAPWLQKDLSPAGLRAVFEKELWSMNEVWEIAELIFPADFQVDGNQSTLADLKEDQDWREPRKISPETTDENFRQWLSIEFLPDEQDERIEFDGWFDFWCVLVESNGELRIGFFEFADVD